MNEPLQELACLYVLDRLDASERAVFEARLLREPELAAFVRELEATVSESIHALPQAEVPPTTFSRIEARIAIPVPVGSSSKTARPNSGITWVSFARWGLAAVIALSLTTIAVQSLRHSPASPVIVLVGLDSNRNTFTELPLRDVAKDEDARFMQLASLAEKYWQQPRDLPERPKLPSSGSRGYALFDPASLQGFIAVEQLPAIAESQRYHLWVLDPATGQIRDVGILPLSGGSSGLYSFTLGADGDPQTARPQIFITIEEAAGSAVEAAQPHGKVILGDHRI